MSSIANAVRIRKNAADSPLLRAPPEVREKILLNVIGDKVIHIRFIEGYNLASLYAHEGKDEKEAYGKKGALRHAICVLSLSGKSAYEEAMCAGMTKHYGEPSGGSLPSCVKRHNDCTFHSKYPDYVLEEDREALKLDLKVLGASRQLYEEANYLLWATNVFSFHDPCSFDKFFASLNPAQKRNLTNLHLEAGSDWDPQSWKIALKKPYLSMLRSVRHLHLCFEQYFTHYLGGESRDEAMERSKKDLEDYVEPFLRLRVLPQKHVTAVVHNFTPGPFSRRMEKLEWTVGEKQDAAESICARLMDPRGVELVKADADAARTDDLRWSVKCARRDVERALRRARNWQGTADTKRRTARNAAATADRAATRAELAERKGRDDAKLLRKLATSAASKASYRERLAEEYQEKAKGGRNWAREKEQKHERAIARLADFESKIGVKATEANDDGKLNGDSSVDEEEPFDVDLTEGENQEGAETDEDSS